MHADSPSPSLPKRGSPPSQQIQCALSTGAEEFVFAISGRSASVVNVTVSTAAEPIIDFLSEGIQASRNLFPGPYE